MTWLRKRNETFLEKAMQPDTVESQLVVAVGRGVVYVLREVLSQNDRALDLQEREILRRQARDLAEFLSMNWTHLDEEQRASYMQLHAELIRRAKDQGR